MSIYINISQYLCVYLCVPYRPENYWELEAEILHRSRLFPKLNDRLYAAARSFKKIFYKILSCFLAKF